MNYETENIEFKSQFTEELYKEVIAFANTDGGTVCVGVETGGNVIGLRDVDQEYTRITNGIRDAIMPDVTMFVRFTIQDNKVYENCSEQPIIEAIPNAFKITLPNMNAAANSAIKNGASITPQMHKILAYLDTNGEITEAEIGAILELKKTRAFTVAKQMREMGLIQVVGRGTQKRYLPK